MMKTHVLDYGAYPRHNDIVTKYMELTKISDGIYYSLLEENKENHDRDELLVVLNVDCVYFVYDNYHRKEIFTERYLGNMSLLQKNWIEITKEKATKNQYVRNMEISVFRALGLDTTELIRSRETALRNREEEKRLWNEEYERKKEQKRQCREMEQNIRLDKAKADFLANNYISSDDFLAIIKRDGYDVHIRTMGTIRQRLTLVRKDGGYYFRPIKGKRRPDVTGFGEVLFGYVRFLETQNSDVKA